MANKKGINQFLKSPAAKKIFFIGTGFLLFFFLFNDVLMHWYVDNETTATIPAVVGLKYEQAVSLLDSLGFEPRKGDVRMDREHPADIVIIQNPPEGAKVKTGRRVYLTVSAGEITVTVPDIKGRTLRDARFSLEKEGLRMGTVVYQSSDDFPAGTVMGQNVSPGSKLKKDVSVSCVVSQGSSDSVVQIPDVTGKSLAEAEKLLRDAGLIVGNITYISSNELLPNTVIDQYPRMGEKALPEKRVDLIVVQASGNNNRDN